MNKEKTNKMKQNKMSALAIAREVLNENRPIDRAWVRHKFQQGEKNKRIFLRECISSIYPDLTPQMLGRATTELEWWLQREL